MFWSQYAEAEHPVPPSDQLKQLVELHKVAEQAMKGLIARLWPGEAMPGSYFGLVWRLVDACPWIEVVKRSICIEGARRALACDKVHWAKIKAAVVAVKGPPGGKDHCKPERYFEDVLEGARLIEGQCLKAIMFE